MIVLVSSLVDVASRNIADALLPLVPWEPSGEFDGVPAHRWRDRLLVTIRDEHLFRDNLDLEVTAGMGVDPEAVVYLSRHRAASGIRSLTVHPLGNYAAAEYGGRPGTLVPPAPGLMTSALRELKRAAKGLAHRVTLEATHHGPYLGTPAFYMEVGSDEGGWQDPGAAEAVATAASRMRVLDHPVAVGVGGGHYVPRLTDVALSRDIALGHMVPRYALEEDWEEAVRLATDATPGAELACLHEKGIPEACRRQVREWFGDRGLRTVRGGDLPVREPGE